MKDKLIYASAARKAILDADPKLAYCIDEIPGVDAVEVVHGRWIMGVDEAAYDYGVCSVCNFAEREHIPCLYIPSYCPNCGADMRGDKDGK